MFFPRTEPLELGEASLHSLRLSLNTPVVEVEGIAHGPARAILIVHDEADGTASISIGIRSLKSGEVMLYSLEGDLADQDSSGVGTDAALSFAESMGFLFDEDEIAGGGEGARSRALGMWRELMGMPEPAEAPELPDEEEPGLEIDPIPDDQPLELLQEERPEVEAGALPGASDDLCTLDLGAEAVELGPPRRPTLSKFRRPDESADDPNATAPPGEVSAGRPGAPLGRLKLVKRRRPGIEAREERRDPITRLLTSY